MLGEMELSRSYQLKLPRQVSHALSLVPDWTSALQPQSLSHTLTITCTCCYDEIKATQDLKIYSHAGSLIRSPVSTLTYIQSVPRPPSQALIYAIVHCSYSSAYPSYKCAVPNLRLVYCHALVHSSCSSTLFLLIDAKCESNHTGLRARLEVRLSVLTAWQ